MTNVTIWNEHIHEREDPAVADRYPDGIHGAIAEAFDADEYDVRTATLDDPEQGVPPSLLEWTDVLVWWEHLAHDEIADETARRVRERVLDGMGLIMLHSSKDSPIFSSLVGTTGDSKWRNDGTPERLWVVDPGHPIAHGLEECVELPAAATYGEPFDIPQPDSVVFTSWFEGGEVFRSGVCFRRGAGNVFYFRPGDEEYPIYHDEDVRRVLRNAAEWAAPIDVPDLRRGNTPPANER